MQARTDAAALPATDAQAVGDRLRAARLQTGLSQQGWADLLGESRQRVIDVERGKQRPPAEMLAAAVAKAGLSPAWLVSGVGEMLDLRDLSSDQALEITKTAALEAQAFPTLSDAAKRLLQDWLVAIRTRNESRIRELAEPDHGRLSHEVCEPPAQYRDEQMVSEPRLQRSIELVEQAVEAEAVALPVAKRSQLVITVYEMLGGGVPITPAAVRRLVRLAT